MNITLKNLVAGGLLSAVATVGLGLAAGTAHAAPFHWCPGDPPIMGNVRDANGSMKPVPIYPAWDTSVCHDYGINGNHVEEGKACVLPQFQWFQCPPGTTPVPLMPMIPNKGE
jgi:hypothetical protein